MRYGNWSVRRNASWIAPDVYSISFNADGERRLIVHERKYTFSLGIRGNPALQEQVMLAGDGISPCGMGPQEIDCTRAYGR